MFISTHLYIHMLRGPSRCLGGISPAHISRIRQAMPQKTNEAALDK